MSTRWGDRSCSKVRETVVSEGQVIDYREGGRVSEVLPLQQKMGGGGRGRKGLSHAEATSFEVILTQELEVLAILKGVQKASSLYKQGRGWRNSFTRLEGWGVQQISEPQFFSVLAPPPPPFPLPVIDDQSLTTGEGCS